MLSNDDRLRKDFRYPTAQEIQRNMDSGRRVRDEAIAAAIAGIWRAVRKLARRGADRLPGRLDHASNAAIAMRTPPTAIRSSAKNLRNHPEMAAAERAHLAGRPSRLIAHAFRGSRIESR